MQRRRLHRTSLCFNAVAVVSAAFVLGCGSGEADRDTPLMISTGRVVLVRRGRTYGAFIILKQTKQPEAVSYVWCLGSAADGDLGRPDVRQFRNLGRSSIRFAPFALAWSYRTHQSGWLYPAAGTSVCVTEETSWNGIDAAAPKWRYRTYNEEGGLWPGRNADGLSENQELGLLHFKQGRAKLSTGDFKGAIAELDTAIRSDPHHDVAYTMRGDAHRSVLAIDRARRDYAEAVSLGLEEGLIGLAFADFDAGNWHAASREFQSVLSHFPDKGWYWVMAHIAKARADHQWHPMRPKQGGALATEQGKIFALVLALYTGKIEVDEYFSKSSEEAAKLRSEDLFRIKFYGAQYYLLHGQPSKALEVLRACLRMNVRNLPELPSARAELQRLQNP